MTRYFGDNLAGAWAVMRGRPEGLARLDLTIEGFWRSFAAIVLLIPFAVLGWLSQREVVEALRASADAPADLVMVGPGTLALALGVEWITFPLVFAILARPLGVESRYVPFIVARNWSAVVLSAIFGIVAALQLVGLVPTQLMPIPLVAMRGLSLWFAFVVARTTLDVTIPTAIGIVLLDFLISLVILFAAERIG